MNKGRREKHFHTRAERAMKSISKLKTGVFIYNLNCLPKLPIGQVIEGTMFVSFLTLDMVSKTMTDMALNDNYSVVG